MIEKSNKKSVEIHSLNSSFQLQIISTCILSVMIAWIIKDLKYLIQQVFYWLSSWDSFFFVNKLILVCNGNFIARKEPQKIYSHANYGLRNYPKNESCRWGIETQEDRCISITFDDFEVESLVDNTTNDECK